jgi:hypothetical protein
MAAKTATAAAVTAAAALGKHRNSEPKNHCERKCGKALHARILLPFLIDGSQPHFDPASICESPIG